MAPRRRVRRRNRTNGQYYGVLVAFISMFMVVSYLSNAIFGVDILASFASTPSGSSAKGKVVKKGASSPALSKRLLAEAVKYDPKPYVWASGHPPTEKSSKRGVDCSGLINVAVYKVTGINENRVAESFRRSKHWKKIKMSEAGPGDIMYDLKDPGDSTDHVVFVVKNPGSGKMTIFEARTQHGPLKEQIRYSYNQKYSRFDGALRFVK